jgi:hypothetical protein
LHFANPLENGIEGHLICSFVSGAKFEGILIDKNLVICKDLSFNSSSETLQLEMLWNGVYYKLSSNSLVLNFHPKSNISFLVGTKPIAATSTSNVVNVQSSVLTASADPNLKCSLNGTLFSATRNALGYYTCTVNTPTKGIQLLSLVYLSPPNTYRIPGISGSFLYKIDLNFTSSIANLNTKAYFVFNTLALVSEKKIKFATCTDFIVTFNGQQIPRFVRSPNTAASQIQFLFQADQRNIISTNYTIYYGNSVPFTPLLIADSSNSLFVPSFAIETDVVTTVSNEIKYALVQLTDASYALSPDTFLGPSNVSFPNVIDYQKLVSFTLVYSSVSIPLIYENNSLNGFVNAPLSQVSYLYTLRALHVSGDSFVITTTNSIYFWSFILFH